MEAGGDEEVRGASPEAGGAVVRVLPFVRGDHRRRVLVRPLHPLLHPALGRRAPVVAPAYVAIYITLSRFTLNFSCMQLKRIICIRTLGKGCS